MVIIILGSKSDLELGKEIVSHLRDLGVSHKMHIASAHKTPQHTLEIIQKYDKTDKLHVYICVAGKSNALGGFVDAQTSYPVINCPPYSEKYAGLDILSSLRMPGGVSSVTVLEPDQAALTAVKILSIGNASLRKSVVNYQKNFRKKIIHDDKNL